MSSFRDFFDRKFYFEDTYLRPRIELVRPRYTIVNEMAMPLDISKIPAKFDKDDREFLQQFEPELWIQAMRQRYQHFYKYLRKRHDKRVPLITVLKEKLKKALVNDNWSALEGHLPDEQLQRIRQRYPKGWIDRYDNAKDQDEALEEAAQFIAEKEVENMEPHVPEPTAQEEGLPQGYDGYMKFSFKSHNRAKEADHVVLAKPFFNRLAHKLERTKGEPHVAGSGLEGGVGEYGYDLHDPREGTDGLPPMTRGMTFPNKGGIEKRMSDFMSQNAHGIYGDLPKDAKWLKTKYKDTFAYLRHYWPAFWRWYQVLKSSEPGSIQMPDGTRVPPEGGWDTNDQREKAARKLTDAEMMAKAQKNELRGPPIPGVSPEGMPVELKIDDNGEVTPVAPPLYLPHEEKEITYHTAKGVVKKKKLVPLVNPATYFRILGSEAEDFVRDEEGKLILDEKGKPQYTVPDSERRGHDRMFVHVPHDEYKKGRKGYYASGALHFTQNSAGRKYLSKGDPRYTERFEEIFGDMNQIGLNKDGKPAESGVDGNFYDDVIAGIWQCLYSSQCGGATSHEKEILQASIEDMHQIIVQRMLMTMRDDDKLLTPAGRRAFALDTTKSYMQQDFGKGGKTRRKRVLKQSLRTQTTDGTTTGKEGDAIGFQDEIMARMKDRETGFSTERGKGGRKLVTGSHQFAYHVDNMRRFLDELERDAKAADLASDKAKQVSQSQVGDNVIGLLRGAIKDKAIVLAQIRQILLDIHTAQGMMPDEAEERVQARIINYLQQGQEAERLVRSFEADPHIQNILAANSAARPEEGGDQMSPDEVEAVDKLHTTIEAIRSGGKDINDPQIKAMLMPQAGQEFGMYVQQIGNQYGPGVKDKVMRRVQDEINKLYGGAAKPQPTAAAARPVQTAPAAPAPAAPAPAAPAPGGPAHTIPWRELHRQKRYADVARHPQFLATALPQNLKDLHTWLRANKGKVDPDDYDIAVARLEAAMRKRGIS